MAPPPIGRDFKANGGTCQFLCFGTLRAQKRHFQVISTPSSGQKKRKTCILTSKWYQVISESQRVGIFCHLTKLVTYVSMTTFVFYTKFEPILAKDGREIAVLVSKMPF